MIPIQKEEKIRQLLADGFSTRGIADRIKVSRETIRTIKSLPEIRKRKPPPRTTEPKSSGLIRLREPTQCKKCGASLQMWPCVLCYPTAESERKSGRKYSCRKKESDIKAVAETSYAETLELFRIVLDLRGLHNLHLIDHQLFLNLAQRAENCLNRILPEEIKVENVTKEKDSI